MLLITSLTFTTQCVYCILDAAHIYIYMFYDHLMMSQVICSLAPETDNLAEFIKVLLFWPSPLSMLRVAQDLLCQVLRLNLEWRSCARMCYTTDTFLG